MKKSIYQNASMNTIIGLFLLGALMVGFSIYLTSHYFSIHFPTGIDSASMCNFNSIFNCDNTTMSPASNIAGVPISIFGILTGALVLAGLFIKNEKFEKSLYFLLCVNMIGCIGLFLYSLIALGGLCPFCTFYYILSGIVLYMFFKKSESPMPNIPYLAGFAVLFLAVSFAVRADVQSKKNKQSAVAQSIVNQYYALPNLGQPSPESTFIIAHSSNPVIKMQVFSDFQCPACKMLSDQMPAIMNRYAGKIEIQYYFFPLDHNCNPSIQRPMHTEACRGAYVSSCVSRDDFVHVHDAIFENQHNLAPHLDKVIKDRNIQECVSSPATKESVVALINAGNAFNVRSTPTFILNGVKIEGVLPLDQLFAIMDEIVKRAK